MKILIVGDVFSKLGRASLETNIQRIKQEQKINFIIVNGENISHGRGMNEGHYLWLLNQGANVITMGNHTFNQRSIFNYIDDSKCLVRPYNYLDPETKGKGYVPAEDNPSRFHGTGPYDIETGESLSIDGKDSYTSVFSKVMVDIAQQNDKVVAITAAMEDGTGLSAFHKYFPDRFFDVGIAEGHAVTFAAGLAAAGLHPVFAVYSSFLQRGFDQLIHDVCLQNLPVVFAIDRAGLVGSDGETHQGVFDLSYLSMIPNMTVMAPKNKWELADMIRFAVKMDSPVALRYSRGTAYEGFQEYRAAIIYGKSEIIYEEQDIAILCVGNMFESSAEVYNILKQAGYHCSLVNARFVKPIDEAMIDELVKEHKLIVTIEENVQTGGYGEKVLEYVSRKGYDVKVLIIALPDQYIEHGNINVLRKETGIDSQSMTERIIKTYKEL